MFIALDFCDLFEYDPPPSCSLSDPVELLNKVNNDEHWLQAEVDEVKEQVNNKKVTDLFHVAYPKLRVEDLAQVVVHVRIGLNDRFGPFQLLLQVFFVLCNIVDSELVNTEAEKQEVMKTWERNGLTVCQSIFFHNLLQKLSALGSKHNFCKSLSILRETEAAQNIMHNYSDSTDGCAENDVLLALIQNVLSVLYFLLEKVDLLRTVILIAFPKILVQKWVISSKNAFTKGHD